jgi:hypothetical protein
MIFQANRIQKQAGIFILIFNKTDFLPKLLEESKKVTTKKGTISKLWWLTLVIPVTWEAEIGESWFETSPGKKLVKPYLKK